jgi:hypothetical protein
MVKGHATEEPHIVTWVVLDLESNSGSGSFSPTRLVPHRLSTGLNLRPIAEVCGVRKHRQGGFSRMHFSLGRGRSLMSWLNARVDIIVYTIPRT